MPERQLAGRSPNWRYFLPGERRCSGTHVLLLGVVLLLLASCAEAPATVSSATAISASGNSAATATVAPANSRRTATNTAIRDTPTAGIVVPAADVRTGTARATVIVPTATATTTVTTIATTFSTATITPTVALTPTFAPTATRVPIPPITIRPNWDGTQLAAQAGTTLSLVLPAPATTTAGHVPSVSAAGLPAPTVALLADGGFAVTLPIPATARGTHLLLAKWTDGSQASLTLVVGASMTLSTGLGTPDDLTVAPDGSLLYTNLKDNTVNQLLDDTTRLVLVSGLNIPEGLAVTGAASLLIADQGSTRVLQWTAPTGLRTLVQLAVRRGVDGIDGLGVASLDGRPIALLPDSANGRMLLLYLDTAVTVPVPGNWQRPTAAIARNGLLYMVDEYGGRLWRGPLPGQLQPLGPTLNLPDDVVVAADGTIFVNQLGQGRSGGSVVQVNPDGSSTLLLSGLNDPQGLALDAADNLMLAESGNGRISADVRSCLPVLIGSAALSLQVGGPARAISLGSECTAGVTPPTFSLALGARWPSAGTTWSASGSASMLTLPNGVTAQLQAATNGSAVLELRPPPTGPATVTTLAVQLHVGTAIVPRQFVVTLQR